ncbi:MAG TPA: DUF3108 domain-containing protein [Ignavibacteriales bacterium]|jgi:hypothetical protein|nr:DUF3108 domain-containing protein [Ignavibacteriales bacterium]
MKSKLFLLLVILSQFSYSQILRKIENKAFGVGEKLDYEVKYGFVKAGFATWEIPQIVKINGFDTYQVVFTVRSHPSFDWIYKVRDRYETYLDIHGIFPWKFVQQLREGSYKKDYWIEFDHINKKAKTPKGEFDAPQFVNDIVSAFFYVRTLDFSNLKKGDIIQLTNFYNTKVYPLDVIYHGKEIVELDMGKFNCVKVEPIIREGGLFKTSGKIFIWLTDDKIRVPVKVQTQIIIGSINANLINYKGLQGSLNYSK